MSEQPTAPEGQAGNPEGNQTTSTTPVSYETHRKLLNEKKNAVSKLNEYEAELQKLREEKMEREGKQDELISSYREKIQKLEGELGNTKKSFAWNTVKGAIKTEAIKNGCNDSEKLIRLMDDQDLKSISIGEDFSIDMETVKNVIEKNKKENHFLFSANVPPVANGNPSKKPSEPKNKLDDLSKLSDEELEQAYKETFK